MSNLTDLMDEVLQRAYDGLTVKPNTRIIAPGSEVAWDDVCSQLWVRLVSMETRYQKPYSGCPHSLIATLAVGTIRCVKAMGDDGRAPTQQRITSDGHLTTTDSEELLVALACWTPKKVLRSQVGVWTPLGPLGGAAGGEWTYSLVMSL